MTPGPSTSFTATLTATNGSANNVALTVSGLPANTGASFSPASLSGSGSSTLSVTTSNSTTSGNYPLTITATSGNLVYTVAVTLKVRDFSIAATPAAQNVTAGVGTSYTVMVATNNSYTGVVNLSVSGLPGGAGASFNPASVTNTGNSTLSITTSNTTPGDAYTLTITGVNGTLTRSTNVTLNVIGLTNSFSLNTTPSAQTINPGSSANYTTTVGGSVGFTNTVALTVSGMPAGVSAGFNPTSITNGSGSSTLNVIASNSVTPGIYTLTIVGTSGSLTQTNTVTLNIFSFSAAISQVSRTVVASAGTSFTVTSTGTSGISNNVILSVSGLPANTSGGFNPNPMAVTNTGTSTLNVTTATNTPAGNFPLTITGVFGTLTNTATTTLKVTDFSIVASPVSQTVVAGATNNFTVTVTAFNNFSANVAFTAGGLPSGATANFNPSSFSGSGTSTLTITTSGSTAAGTNTVTINGISGGQTHSTNVTFIVTVANTPPVLSPVSNRVVNAGVTLTLTNIATDTDTPAQTLTFNLLTAPTGAVLNANSGIFTWRPAVAQANTTNLTTLKVTDSGTPLLSATQSFSIVVNPLAKPVLGIVRLTNGFWKLNVTGPAGPDYSIQGAGNLVNWAALVVSNSPALPFDWTDTNNVSARFYRVLLGP